MNSLSRKVFFILLPLTFSANSFAFFCPTNFNQIEVGNTMDQVIQQCGSPDSQTGSTETNDDNVPQEWQYFIPQTVATTTLAPVQGTLKTSVTFDDQDKAINITVNGIGVGGTTICNGHNVQLGDSKASVKKACGTAAVVNKQQSDTQQQQIIVTQFTYNANPPVILTFENGKLTKKN